MTICYTHPMTEYIEAANGNRSFSEVTSDSRRRTAEDALAATLTLLKKANVPTSIIADVLFVYTKSFAMPPKGAPDIDNIAWFAQLRRFQDDLRKQTDAIQEVLENRKH